MERQDNTMDGVGPLSLNLYDIETVLKPVNFDSLKGAARFPSERKEPRLLE